MAVVETVFIESTGPTLTLPTSIVGLTEALVTTMEILPPTGTFLPSAVEPTPTLPTSGIEGTETLPTSAMEPAQILPTSHVKPN